MTQARDGMRKLTAPSRRLVPRTLRTCPSFTMHQWSCRHRRKPEPHCRALWPRYRIGWSHHPETQHRGQRLGSGKRRRSPWLGRCLNINDVSFPALAGGKVGDSRPCSPTATSSDLRAGGVSLLRFELPVWHYNDFRSEIVAR